VAQIVSAPARPPKDPGTCVVDVTNILFGGSNRTVTVAFAVIVKPHASNPEHSPPHPAKPMFAAGVAVIVTLAFVATVTVPSALRVVPFGATTTDPPAAPRKSTVSVRFASVNVPVTVVSPVMVNAHAPIEHPAPDQPLNVEPAPAVAVIDTDVPCGIEYAQADIVQTAAPGLTVNEPVPSPARVTVSVRVLGVKVAVTLVAALTVTAQVVVPVQPPPDHPVKVELLSGVAVSVTLVP
jgi:hypothetical protein